MDPYNQNSYGPASGGPGLNTTPNRGFPGAGGAQGPYRSLAHVHGHSYNRFTDPRGYGGGGGGPGPQMGGPQMGGQMPGQPPMGQMGPPMGGNPRSHPYAGQPNGPPAQRRPSSGWLGKMADIGKELWNGVTGADARRRRPRSPPVQQGGMQGGMAGQGMGGMGPRGMSPGMHPGMQQHPMGPGGGYHAIVNAPSGPLGGMAGHQPGAMGPPMGAPRDPRFSMPLGGYGDPLSARSGRGEMSRDRLDRGLEMSRGLDRGLEQRGLMDRSMDRSMDRMDPREQFPAIQDGRGDSKTSTRGRSRQQYGAPGGPLNREVVNEPRQGRSFGRGERDVFRDPVPRDAPRGGGGLLGLSDRPFPTTMPRGPVGNELSGVSQSNDRIDRIHNERPFEPPNRDKEDKFENIGVRDGDELEAILNEGLDDDDHSNAHIGGNGALHGLGQSQAPSPSRNAQEDSPDLAAPFVPPKSLLFGGSAGAAGLQKQSLSLFGKNSKNAGGVNGNGLGNGLGNLGALEAAEREADQLSRFLQPEQRENPAIQRQIFVQLVHRVCLEYGVAEDKKKVLLKKYADRESELFVRLCQKLGAVQASYFAEVEAGLEIDYRKDTGDYGTSVAGSRAGSPGSLAGEFSAASLQGVLARGGRSARGPGLRRTSAGLNNTGVRKGEELSKSRGAAAGRPAVGSYADAKSPRNAPAPIPPAAPQPTPAAPMEKPLGGNTPGIGIFGSSNAPVIQHHVQAPVINGIGLDKPLPDSEEEKGKQGAGLLRTSSKPQSPKAKPQSPKHSPKQSPKKAPEKEGGEKKEGDDEEPEEVAADAKNIWRLNIEAIYRKKNPKKLKSVGPLLEKGGKYHGKDLELFRRVCKNYQLPEKDSKGFIHYSITGIPEEGEMLDEDEAAGGAAASSGTGAPAIGGSILGSVQAGGLFGNPSGGAGASTGGGIFGAPAGDKPAGGGLFGSASSTTPSTGGLFGSSGPGTSGPIGGGGGLFGSSNTGTGGGLFGANPPSGGLFGAPAKPAESGSLFGAPKKDDDKKENTGGSVGSIFGAAAASSEKKETAASGATSIFGAVPAGIAASATPDSTPKQAQSIFGGAAPAPSGGLFGAPKADDKKDSSAPAATSIFGGSSSQNSAPAPAAGTSIFGGRSAAQSTGSLFGDKPPAPPKKSIFSQPAVTPDNDDDDEEPDSDPDAKDSTPESDAKTSSAITKSKSGAPRKSVLAVSSHNASNVFAPDPNKSIWAKAARESDPAGGGSVLGGGLGGGGTSIFKKSKSKNSSGSSLFGPGGFAAMGKAGGAAASAPTAAVSTSFFGNQSEAGLGAPSGGLFGGGSIFGGGKSAFGGQGGAVFGGGEKDKKPDPIPAAAGKLFGGGLGAGNALEKFQANREQERASGIFGASTKRKRGNDDDDGGDAGGAAEPTSKRANKEERDFSNLGGGQQSNPFANLGN